MRRKMIDYALAVFGALMVSYALMGVGIGNKARFFSGKKFRPAV